MELLQALVGKHRCSLAIENGELGVVCICGWSYRSTPKETDVTKMLGKAVLAALVHTTPKQDEAAEADNG